jgi:glutaredoxin
LLVGGVWGCPEDELPPAPEVKPAASSLPEIEVKPGKKMLFTYRAGGDTFTTVDSIDKVPEDRRAWVRVVDLSMKPTQRRDHELVYVADLRRPEEDGAFPYVVISREAFENPGVRRAPPGRAAKPPREAKKPKTVDKQPTGKRPAMGRPTVILYGTSWCPACRSARQYLEKHGISFVEKDIEQDRGAAEELLKKARAAGISASGVPVLDVNGTLIQGFDVAQLKQLLGST